MRGSDHNPMKLFSRLRRRQAAEASPAIPPRPLVGDSLTELTTLDAVFRALAFIQTIAGQLTLTAYRGSAPVMRPLVERPDNSMTQRDWIIATVASLSCAGNAYWRIIRGTDNEVIDLRYIDPARVAVGLDPSGRARYLIDGREVAADSVAHLRYLTLPGSPRGLGPIEAGRRGLAGMLATARFGDSLFLDGGIPKGILSTDQPLTEEQIEEAQRKWDAKQHAGKTAVLGRGISYRPIGIAPAELQWLESQKFGVTKVARLFGIPPIKLAAGIDGASMTYQNLESASLDLVRDTMMGYLSPIEAALSDLLPRGTRARFNLDAILRPDTKSRYEAHEIGLRAGFLTVNEVREMEKLGKMEEAPNEN